MGDTDVVRRLYEIREKRCLESYRPMRSISSSKSSPGRCSARWLRWPPKALAGLSRWHGVNGATHGSVHYTALQSVGVSAEAAQADGGYRNR